MVVTSGARQCAESQRQPVEVVVNQVELADRANVAHVQRLPDLAVPAAVHLVPLRADTVERGGRLRVEGGEEGDVEPRAARPSASSPVIRLTWP